MKTRNALRGLLGLFGSFAFFSPLFLTPSLGPRNTTDQNAKALDLKPQDSKIHENDQKNWEKNGDRQGLTWCPPWSPSISLLSSRDLKEKAKDRSKRRKLREIKKGANYRQTTARVRVSLERDRGRARWRENEIVVRVRGLVQDGKLKGHLRIWAGFKILRGN